MARHLSMGGINKSTNQYEYPEIAEKTNKYKCPDCYKDIIFKKGSINRPHFAHYADDDPCSYYTNPGESQIHKDAKLALESILNNKRQICISKKCSRCNINDIYNIQYSPTTIAHCEFRFIHNDSNKSADVALLENDIIKYIFEICYKNKTKPENRPEPWFEFDANICKDTIHTSELCSIIQLTCIRSYKCTMCIDKDIYIKEQRRIQHEQWLIQEEQRIIQEKINKIQDDERRIKAQQRLKEEEEKTIAQEAIKREKQLKKEEERKVQKAIDIEKKAEEKAQQLINTQKKFDTFDTFIKETKDNSKVECKCEIPLLYNGLCIKCKCFAR